MLKKQSEIYLKNLSPSDTVRCRNNETHVKIKS